MISQVQSGLAAAPVQADTGLLLVDEACGQVMVDRLLGWLAQELGGARVCALPVKGREADGQARVQVLFGQAGAQAFGPIADWGFDSLAAALGGEDRLARFVAMDPRTPFFAQRLNWLHEAGQGALLGAMGAPMGSYLGPSGLGFGVDCPVIWQTFPGVEPRDQLYTITAAQGQVIHEIDGRPALDVLREAAGEILARKLMQIPAYLFAAFPVSPTDPHDILVRRINGLGQRSATFSIDDDVLPGMVMTFARRNGPFVAQVLKAGVANLLQRAGGRLRAAIFLSDARRAADFTNEGGEVALVRHILGDVPLIEGQVTAPISHNRLYPLASQLIFLL